MNVKTLKIFTHDFVSKIMPHASVTYIKRYWPTVLFALQTKQIDYESMVLMSLATISAEVGNFDITVREYVSHYNTTEIGRQRNHYFDKYDDRSDLGNQGKPDGYLYRGGGAIQLTGRDNFRRVGRQIGVPLEDEPDLVSHPIVSSLALAQFLKNKEEEIKEALADMNLRTARKLVNGGSHGLDRFTETFRRGQKLIEAQT